jgi:alanyl-tRNA synthetase
MAGEQVEVKSVVDNEQVEAKVDAGRRASVAAHHTATHLLQAALRRVLGADVAQQGSLVEPDRLRFDFNLPRAMTAAEVQTVESLINGWIAEDHPSVTRVLPLQEAKAAGTSSLTRTNTKTHKHIYKHTHTHRHILHKYIRYMHTNKHTHTHVHKYIHAHAPLCAC